MSSFERKRPFGYSRRELLRHGLHGIGVSAALPLLMGRTSAALATSALAQRDTSERILVVVELSGGNDGLNTVVPYSNDIYYRVRPTIGIRKEELLLLDEDYGLHPSMQGFEKLWKDGSMAIVHGCGYDNPSLSHFESMGFWHTGVPNGGEQLGWVGRFADLHSPHPRDNLIVNVANSQSPAVRSGVHTPLVFGDPNRFRWNGSADQEELYKAISESGSTDDGNETLGYLNGVAANAARSSRFVREACQRYRTPVDYGVGAGLGDDLRKVAALIDAGLPTSIYYVAAAGNSFDTHVHQSDLHARLLMYTADAMLGFMNDLRRIGRSKDVAILVFTEFGRRVEQNASLGTDHGTATPLFIVGDGVEGGFYGQHPSLVELDDGNMIMTTDFRRVYATMISEWMGFGQTDKLLKGEYAPLGIFA